MRVSRNATIDCGYLPVQIFDRRAKRVRLHPAMGVQFVCDVHFQYLQLADSHDFVVQLIEVFYVFAQHLLIRFAQRVLVVHCALFQIVQRKRPIVVKEKRSTLAVHLFQSVEYHKAKHSIQSIESGCSECFLGAKVRN